MTAPSGRAQVLRDAAVRWLEIEVVQRPPADSLEQAAVLPGLEARRVVISLVVRRHTPVGAPNEYLCALIPGDRIAVLGATVVDISVRVLIESRDPSRSRRPCSRTGGARFAQLCLR